MSSASLSVIALGVVLTLPIAARVLRRQFDPFEPIFLFVLAYGAMFVARPAYMLVHGDLSYGGVDLRRTFPEACVLALIGGVAFVSGYELRPGSTLARRLPPPRSIAVRAAVIWAIVLTALAGLALLSVLIRFSGLSGVRILLTARTEELTTLSAESSYVWFGMRLVVPAAVCLAALALRERSRSLGGLAAILMALSLLVTVPLGSRIFLLPLLGGILVFAYVHRRTRPGPLLLVGLAVGALLVSFGIGVIRDPERRAHSRTEFAALIERPVEILSPILEGNDAEMAPVLAGALTVVPERLHFRYGDAVVGELVRRPVPRELWSGKPKPPEETIVSAVWPDLSGYFHPVFSPLLVFYWDFWIPGVVAGMALFGIGCRALYEWFLRHRDRFAAQLIFAMALWFVVIGARNNPVETIVLASFVVLPLVLLERFSAVRLPIARLLRGSVTPSQR